MNSLVTQVAQEVVDPQTGEVIHRKDIPAVGRLLGKVRDLQRQFRNLNEWANDAIVEYMDERAEWTIHAAGMKFSAPSPEAADIEWDLEELEKLQEHLPADRYGELVRMEISHKPQTVKLHQAAKAGGEIAKIIERAERRTPKQRRSVTVKGA